MSHLAIQRFRPPYRALPIALAIAAAIGLANPTEAAIIVDPNNLGATDITDSVGNPLDPTVGVLGGVALVVGSTASGELRIDNSGGPGAVISGTGVIGHHSGSDGSVTVSGGAWNAAQNLRGIIVGLESNANGRLHIENGGAVFATDMEIGLVGTGDVTVSGAFSQLETNGTFAVGAAGGDGSLSITDGARVTTAQAARLGDSGDSNGSVTVSGINADGSRSRWEVGSNLTIGGRGTGLLTITDGATAVSSAVVVMGDRSDGDGQVIVSGTHANGTASSWDALNLRVGQDGRGRLVINGGARVNAGLLTLGNGGDGDGDALVTGVGSALTISDDLGIGVNGQGRLTVRDGGSVSAAGDIILGNTRDADVVNGALDISGAGSRVEATAGSDFVLGASSGATLSIADGACSPTAVMGGSAAIRVIPRLLSLAAAWPRSLAALHIGTSPATAT